MAILDLNQKDGWMGVRMALQGHLPISTPIKLQYIAILKGSTCRYFLVNCWWHLRIHHLVHWTAHRTRHSRLLRNTTACRCKECCFGAASAHDRKRFRKCSAIGETQWRANFFEGSSWKHSAWCETHQLSEIFGGSLRLIDESGKVLDVDDVLQRHCASATHGHRTWRLVWPCLSG